MEAALMQIESRRLGARATVHLRGASDEATGIDLFSELTRLLEAGVTTIVVDTRRAVTVPASVRAVAVRFHHLLPRLGGSLTMEPPSDAWVHHVVPSQKPSGPRARARTVSGPSHWFG